MQNRTQTPPTQKQTLKATRSRRSVNKSINISLNKEGKTRSIFAMWPIAQIDMIVPAAHARRITRVRNFTIQPRGWWKKKGNKIRTWNPYNKEPSGMRKQRRKPKRGGGLRKVEWGCSATGSPISFSRVSADESRHAWDYDMINVLLPNRSTLTYSNHPSVVIECSGTTRTPTFFTQFLKVTICLLLCQSKFATLTTKFDN